MTIRFIILIALYLVSSNLYGQKISGIVISKSDKKPLEYVTIGVLHKTIGTITDEDGQFSLNPPNLSSNDSIRISIVGFIPQTHAIANLNLGMTFALEEDIVFLNEIVVNSKYLSHTKNIGTKSSSKHIVTGWGQYGTGGERGIKIRFKQYPILINELNFSIANMDYDSVLLRLHIRSIKNKLPDKELLNQNILILVKIKSGRVRVNLEDYNILLEQDVVISFEWLKAWGTCSSRSCLHFSASFVKGTLFAKEASEANWLLKKSFSPGIYLNIKY